MSRSLKAAAEWRLSADLPRDAAELVVKDYDASLESPVVFSALPGEIAGEIEQRMAREGRKERDADPNEPKPQRE